jgi:uncharacterized RDD family membrane protein YckC
MRDNTMDAAREYVGFWPRVLAHIIDNAVLFLIGFIISLVMLLYWVLFSQRFIPKEELTPIVFLTDFSYYMILWLKKQATVGKMVIHAIIIDAKTGGIPTTRQFAGRYFAMILSALPLGLGFIWVAFDKQKRGWHDILAGTLVVKQ